MEMNLGYEQRLIQLDQRLTPLNDRPNQPKPSQGQNDVETYHTNYDRRHNQLKKDRLILSNYLIQ